MNEQLSFEEAKRLSIIKWEILKEDSNTKLETLPKELQNIAFNCGFCERWKKGNGNFPQRFCHFCELGKVAGICTHRDSLFDKWIDSANGAEKMLEIIKSLKENS